MICECGCGEEVKPRTDGKIQRYKKGHRGSVDTACAKCGSPVRVGRARFEKFEKHYCSRACQGADSYKVETRPCSICNTPVSRTPSRFVWESVLCDSPKCKSTFHAITQPRNRVQVQCSNCGQTLLVRPSKLRTNRNHYCSRSCRAVAITGPGNPSYTGGLGRRGNYGGRWKSIRDAIVKRDDATCQHCGIRPDTRRLDVHHIVPVWRFGDDIDSAHDPSNLITLCRTCHRKAEKIA